MRAPLRWMTALTPIVVAMDEVANLRGIDALLGEERNAVGNTTRGIGRYGRRLETHVLTSLAVKQTQVGKRAADVDPS